MNICDAYLENLISYLLFKSMVPLIAVISYLVLTVSEAGGKSLSFVVDESSEFLLKLLDFEFKISVHLLYKQVSWVCISPLCGKHNLVPLFLELKFVSQITIV